MIFAAAHKSLLYKIKRDNDFGPVVKEYQLIISRKWMFVKIEYCNQKNDMLRYYQFSAAKHQKAMKETLASRTSTGRRRHRLRALSGWTRQIGNTPELIFRTESLQQGFPSRGIRRACVTGREWSYGFCIGPFSMRVVPRSMNEYNVPSRSM